MEKQTQLPTIAPTATPKQPSPKNTFWRRSLAAACIGYALFSAYRYSTAFVPNIEYTNRHRTTSSPKCYQPPALFPADDNKKLEDLYKHLSTETFANASITRLQGAVRVRTESFDDLGEVGEDERWNVFYGFHDYLKSTYPSIHEKLLVEKVNTHGLLYTWKGSDDSLKPTLLMAHQDVVPVPDSTVDSWTYPPFDGVFDGTYVWGRGANDCKNQLTAIMDSVELLVDADFQPQRTLLLSFGFDEESAGTQGAGRLAPFLLDRYGDDGVAVLVDEGLGYMREFGSGFAMPAVAEKGYVDVEIAVHTPGGHSSVPADHTSIGILSELVTAIEAEQYPTYLDARNPYLAYLQCGAEHAADFPKKLRKLLDARAAAAAATCSAPKAHDKLALEAARLGGPEARYLMQTSQAVDIIRGGVKVNAMPEAATATVNHRINIGDTPDTVRARLARLAGALAQKYRLQLDAFGDETGADNSTGSSSGGPNQRAITLRARKTLLEVAPVSPSDAAQRTPYRVLAGTIRAVFGDKPIVAPGIMSGNTDTRYYWPLTRHIFRFGPGSVGETESGLGKIHTVDERIAVSNHIKTVKWFMMFIRNMDEARLQG